MEKRGRKNGIKVTVVAALFLAAIALFYTHQLDKTVSANVIQSITELAEHDENTIRSYVLSTWTKLGYLEGKLRSYRCQTLEEMETQMNVECANSDFSHIYMVAADGKIYTDKFVTYDPAQTGQAGRMDLLPYFEEGAGNIVFRFDDIITLAGVNRESILYGIPLEDFSVEGVEMVGLVGLRDISSIEEKLIIRSFTEDGVSRGYSAVIDTDGDYIVDVDRTVYLNSTDNFFSRVDRGQKSDLTSQEVREKMENNESFAFYYTTAAGVERIVYCMPLEDDSIPWYFLSSVESTVFTEQNRDFLTLSIAMLVAVAVVVMAVLIFFLVSQRKIITARADAKARASFLANMSHEIRTPLNGILGLIFLMEKDLEEGAHRGVIRQRLGKARETAEYLLSLVNNILDISKLQAGKVTLKSEPISPESIVDAIWSMQRNNIENRGITFVVQKELSVPWILGDDLALKQVLMNILGNAAKFTHAGGTITFSARQSREAEDEVTTVFTCADTGVGMSEEFLGHIWDSFSQERSSTDTGTKGTGLGMAISKRLVEAMGGQIAVQSAQGVGSTFTVTLRSPVAQAPVTDEPPDPLLPQILAQRGEAVRILVAEDNELNAEILEEILELEGFQVIHAANGQAAVDQFRASQPGQIQAILMDMQMPILDGCGATAQIRAMDRPDAATVPIFACTANNFNEDRARAEACGMSDFLSKPIDMGQLLKKLSKLLGSQPGAQPVPAQTEE